MASTAPAPETPQKKRTLFNIGDDLLALEALIESVDGDISDPKVEAAIGDWLKEMQQDQAVKCDGYVGLIRKWEGELAAAKAEADQYKKAMQVRQNRIDTLKARLKTHMEVTGQLKIETATGRTIAIQKNGGVAPLCIAEGTEPTKIDPTYQKVVITFDNEAIRAACEAGHPPEFASLGDRGTSLRIH